MTEMPDEITKAQLQGIRAQIMAMSDTIHQRMNDLHTHDKEMHKRIEKTIDETFTQVKATNSRVTELEKGKIIKQFQIGELQISLDKLNKNTKAVQFIHKYPRITGMLSLTGILMLIKEFRDLVFQVVGEWYQMIKLM